MTFSEQLKADIALIEPALEKYLSRETGEGYDRIFEAAKYSAMAGGKRLRPVIVLEFCRLCGGDIEKALPFACALEMIHTYSLIHDDLPCMDNDDLRRGRPTCHKAFDEATAVLAGDGLLTAAFETASAAKDVPAETIVRCIRILGENAGMNGMIGGQVLDMGAEHRKISLDELRLLQKLKTGCLLRAACELDIEGDAATLGKSIGKDAASEKSTFPSLLGLEECRELAAKLTEEAVDAVKPLDGHAFLVELARSLTGRTR